MISISALYANSNGSRFDSRYYTTTHADLAAKLLKPYGLLAMRITVGVNDLQGAPPPFWAISELQFSSRASFDDAMSKCGDTLFQDAKNYTDVNPIMQLSELRPE